MERLESTCMLLFALGESIKNIDKRTDKKFLIKYQSIEWKKIMQMRDIIVHHYFDIDIKMIFDISVLVNLFLYMRARACALRSKFT
jgi:uncharacterized protein with HEPN domain